MTPLLAATATAASAALIALFLARGRMAGRLYLDALAVGLTLGAAVAVALAPFELRTNALHFSPQTMAFLFAGLPEEGVKLVGVAAFLRGHYLARGRGDVVFAAGALSLGFAALEDIFYLGAGGAGWTTLAVERALTAVPFHVFVGLAGGYVVASLRPGFGGVALGAAAWIGLAAIHGVYDFAAFAGSSGAAAPEAFRRLVAALGLDVGASLRALLAGAEAAAALAGSAAVLALRPWPVRAPPRGRLARLACSRGLGSLLGFALSGAASLALIAGALAGFMLESADLFFRFAILAVMPLALGVLYLAGPAPPPSGRLRRAGLGFGVAAALALVAAAWVWGPAQWRWLDALRFEARGARLAARGDYAGAVEAYGRALAVEPGRIEALSLRAGAETEMNRYDAALADLDAALRVEPQAITLYLQRAEVDRRRNAPGAAAADLEAALKRRPGDPEIMALRAQARLEAGDAKGAHDDLVEASRSAPHDGLTQRVFASYDVNAGDLDGALRELNAALHANPADSEAAFQRGRVWLYRGEPARAHADFLHADDKPAVLYPALWAFLADARLRRDGGADLRKRLAASPSAWPAPVARLLLGDIGFDAARAAAASDGERCEADFYFAMSRLAADGPDASAERLRAAVKECPSGFIEYEGAKAELRRMAP
jgi:tetratricopeptide (TPR) repeat protein